MFGLPRDISHRFVQDYGVGVVAIVAIFLVLIAAASTLNRWAGRTASAVDDFDLIRLQIGRDLVSYLDKVSVDEYSAILHQTVSLPSAKHVQLSHSFRKSYKFGLCIW